MASRPAASRRVPDTESAITYVQCDGLVSDKLFKLLNLLWSCVYELG